MSFQVEQVTPVLRIFDLPLALTFYVDYVGCSLDWQEGDPTEGPVYIQVSNGSLVLHLSTHHGDGTPGGVVLVEVHGIKDLHRTLAFEGVPLHEPWSRPRPGRAHAVDRTVDPFGNLIRFFERNVEL